MLPMVASQTVLYSCFTLTSVNFLTYQEPSKHWIIKAKSVLKRSNKTKYEFSNNRRYPDNVTELFIFGALNCVCSFVYSGIGGVQWDVFLPEQSSVRSNAVEDDVFIVYDDDYDDGNGDGYGDRDDSHGLDSTAESGVGDNHNRDGGENVTKFSVRVTKC